MTDDERVARRQRQAYGAETPDAVRARAAAELAELSAAARLEAHAPMPGSEAPADPAAETVGIAPTGPAFGSGEPGTQLEDTDLLQLFDRLPPVDDPSRVEQAVQDIDPRSVRLLATRADGPAAYLARTLDGTDVCLVLLLPAGPSPSTCTATGLLPAEGLRIRYDADGYGFAVANLNGSGTVTLGLIVGF